MEHELLETSPPPAKDCTKIIATVGPACASVDVLRAMIVAGTDCFRINFSHGEAESLEPLMNTVREAERLEGARIALLADIQGPKLRVGSLPNGGVQLVEGREFVLTARDVDGTETIVHTPYAGLPRDVQSGARILLSDGSIELEVVAVRGDDVHTVVKNGGRLYSNKGLNLPGRRVSIETLTEKDRRDLAFITQTDIDLVAISFVRRAEDVVLARELLRSAEKKLIVAKLERFEALENLDAIFGAADGVMVARGDLGVELPFERVPVLQKRILEQAARRGVWTIVATQMLASMVHSPRPSRAEASDVLNAVLDGADAIMLSEETAIGQYPVRAVEAMNAVARAAEDVHFARVATDSADDLGSFAAGAARAAVAAAERIRARAIVTLAGSGVTALLVSKWRPKMPVIALSSTPATLRRLNLLRGVRPVEIRHRADVEEQLLAADRALLAMQQAEPGDVIVMAAAIPLGAGRETNTIRFHRVRETGPSSYFPRANP